MEKTSCTEGFLQAMTEGQWMVDVITTNGYHSRGQIVGWDREGLLVEINGNQQLIFRSAVSTVIPMGQLTSTKYVEKT